VILRIQENRPPYTALAEAYTIPLTAEWQQITVRGYVTGPLPATLMVAADTPGTIFVDDMQMSYTPGTFAPTPNVGTISPAFFGMQERGDDRREQQLAGGAEAGQRRQRAGGVESEGDGDVHAAGGIRAV
jgi:hypothetical protein